MRDQAILFRTGKNIPTQLVVLTSDFEKEGNVWVGTCLELGTSAYSATLEKTRNQLAEAIVLQLNEVERLGFMGDYMRERGVRPIPIPPRSRKRPQSDRWVLVTAGA